MAALDRLIRAAGGVVWRDRDGDRQVCLVHRGRYDDWALPKGKLAKGEHPLAAAVREVREETGVSVWPQVPLGRVRYRVDGAPKIVDFWAMAAREVPPFQPNSEVDDLAWLPASTAARRLSYRHDAELLRRWCQMPPVTSLVLLVRHAFAGQKGGTPGPDHARPLTLDGAGDARRLCRLLQLFSPQRLVSASPRRCVQTLTPLAGSTGLPLEIDEVFDENVNDPAAAAERVRQLATGGSGSVVCTQGRIIAPMLAHLTGDPRCGRTSTSKGDAWVVPFTHGHPLAPARLGAIAERR